MAFHHTLFQLLWLAALLGTVIDAMPALNSEFEFGAHMGCHSSGVVRGERNMHALNYPTPVLLSRVENGTLYRVDVPGADANASQSFFLTHLYGAPYYQGYAQGTLLKHQVVTFMDRAYAYIESGIAEGLLNYVPPWLAVMIAELGLDAALDAVYEETKAYVSPDFYDELHGLSDATGVPFMKAVRLHMLPGLTKGACSMFGANGAAVPGGEDGHLLQLRALDWDMDGPFRDYSAITVYHPDPTNTTQGHSWLNIGFTGFIGALTGMSSVQLGISEIGVSYPDSTFGPNNGSESLIPIPGVPFIVLLRDILKYDFTADDAINRMINSKRTCNLILGVGDGKLNVFHGMEYSSHYLNVYDPLNQQPLAAWHPRIKDIVYWGMDWDCPTFNQLLAEQLLENYGNITAATAMRDISAVEQSGDNHLAFYDLTSMELFVAFASPHGVGGPPSAYARQYTYFNTSELFSMPLPANSLV